MIRTKKQIKILKNKKKISNFLKSSKLQHKNRFKIINQKYKKALYYSYLHRKKKIKDKIWLQRLNVKYSKFTTTLKCLKFNLNKKILSQLNLLDNKSFSILIKLIDLHAYIRTIN